MADEYQFIAGLNHLYIDDEFNQTALGGTYFLDKAQTKGPKDFFGFNPRLNMVQASVNLPNSNEYALFGEQEGALLLGGSQNFNDWQVRGSFFQQNFEVAESSQWHLGVDYFFNANWSAGISYTENTLELTGDVFDHWSGNKRTSDDIDLYVRYEMQLSGDDTLAFQVGDAETGGISNADVNVQYFNNLGNDTYLKFQVGYEEQSNTLITGAGYYFSVNTGVDILLADEEVAQLGVSHFFNRNYRITANVLMPFEDDQAYQVSFQGYF